MLFYFSFFFFTTVADWVVCIKYIGRWSFLLHIYWTQRRKWWAIRSLGHPNSLNREFQLRFCLLRDVLFLLFVVRLVLCCLSIGGGAGGGWGWAARGRGPRVLWFDLCNILSLILLSEFNTDYTGASWQKGDWVKCWFPPETKEAAGERNKGRQSQRVHQLAPFRAHLQIQFWFRTGTGLDRCNHCSRSRPHTLLCRCSRCVSGGRISAEQREAADPQDSQCTTAMKTLLYVWVLLTTQHHPSVWSRLTRCYSRSGRGLTQQQTWEAQNQIQNTVVLYLSGFFSHLHNTYEKHISFSDNFFFIILLNTVCVFSNPYIGKTFFCFCVGFLF